jgi:hypothetical protein
VEAEVEEVDAGAFSVLPRRSGRNEKNVCRTVICFTLRYARDRTQSRGRLNLLQYRHFSRSDIMTSRHHIRPHLAKATIRKRERQSGRVGARGRTNPPENVNRKLHPLLPQRRRLTQCDVMMVDIVTADNNTLFVDPRTPRAPLGAYRTPIETTNQRTGLLVAGWLTEISVRMYFNRHCSVLSLEAMRPTG